jgi:hypothetical protein
MEASSYSSNKTPRESGAGREKLFASCAPAHDERRAKGLKLQ